MIALVSANANKINDVTRFVWNRRVGCGPIMFANAPCVLTIQAHCRGNFRNRKGVMIIIISFKNRAKTHFGWNLVVLMCDGLTNLLGISILKLPGSELPLVTRLLLSYQFDLFLQIKDQSYKLEEITTVKSEQ